MFFVSCWFVMVLLLFFFCFVFDVCLFVVFPLIRFLCLICLNTFDCFILICLFLRCLFIYLLFLCIFIVFGILLEFVVFFCWVHFYYIFYVCFFCWNCFCFFVFLESLDWFVAFSFWLFEFFFDFWVATFRSSPVRNSPGFFSDLFFLGQRIWKVRHSWDSLPANHKTPITVNQFMANQY